MSSGIIKQSDKIGIIVSIITAAVYGLYPAAARGAYADGANAIFIVLMTTSVRALLMATFCLLKRKPLYQSKDDRKMALIGGFWQAVSVIGIIGGLAYLSGPIVLVIVFTHTLMLLFFMAWRREIKLDAVTFGSTVAALIGLAFVLDLWSAQTPSHWEGVALAFMAAIATANRLYIYGRQMKSRNPAVVGAETFIVTTVILILIALFKTPVMPETISGWGWAVLCSLSLGTASFGMFYGIALLGSFRWSLFAKIEPIFTALFSVLFLSEYLKAYQYLGMGLVLGSLIVYQIITHRAALKEAILEGQG
ncbi:MAG: DMT family transporter [Bdellovibrionales bacterium]|jgi:drug/metabolite transporter (DMT)-like permease